MNSIQIEIKIILEMIVELIREKYHFCSHFSLLFFKLSFNYFATEDATFYVSGSYSSAEKIVSPTFVFGPPSGFCGGAGLASGRFPS